MRFLVIRLFQVAAVLIGLPGTIGTLYFGGLAIWARWNSSLNSGPYRGDGSIIDISNQLFVGLFRGIGFAADLAMMVLLAICIFLALLGASLWIASMALQTGRLWGRAVAVIAACFLLLVIVVLRQIAKVFS